MRVDTHLHVWTRGDGGGVRIRDRMPELDRDFALSTLQPALDAIAVEQVVLVSAAQEEQETQRLLALARAHQKLVAGVVGWLDLEAPDIAARIGHYVTNPDWRGVRLPLTILEDRQWVARPRVVEALLLLREAGVIAEILAAPDQLETVASVLDELPGLSAVIDHAGNPDFSTAPTPSWRKRISRLAARPETICKVSAFWAPGDPPVSVQTAQPFFSHVLEHFGIARMVAAANWPVNSLAGPYETTWRLLDSLMEHCELHDGERAAILGDNARTFFHRSKRQT